MAAVDPQTGADAAAATESVDDVMARVGRIAEQDISIVATPFAVRLSAEIEQLRSDCARMAAELEQVRGERDEARELAQVSLDILRNVSNESMRELFGVDDMGDLPAWFTRYGSKS